MLLYCTGALSRSVIYSVDQSQEPPVAHPCAKARDRFGNPTGRSGESAKFAVSVCVRDGDDAAAPLACLSDLSDARADAW